MIETNIKNLVINKMTKAQYDALEVKDPNQLYYIVDDEMYVDVARLAVEVDAGKQLIAQAITDKGVPASADESLSELAEKVSEIDWNPNDGFIFTPAYHPKNIGGFISNVEYLIEIDDNTISSIPEFFFAPFVYKAHYITLRNPLLETISFRKILNGTGVFAVSGIQHLTFPNAKSLSFDVPTQGVTIANTLRLDIKAPNVTRVTGAYIFWTRPNVLVNLEVGTLVELFFTENTGQTNLRNITIGNGTDITLNLKFWTATNVIAEGQSGIDELNSNIQNNLVANLKDNTGTTAKTVTFGQNLRNILTAETEQMFADKNWNIAPAKTV